MENHGTSPFLIGNSPLNCWLPKGIFTHAIFPRAVSCPTPRRGIGIGAVDQIDVVHGELASRACHEKKQLIEAHDISLGTIDTIVLKMLSMILYDYV